MKIINLQIALAILLANIIILPAKACPPDIDFLDVHGGLTLWEVPEWTAMYYTSNGYGLLQFHEGIKTWYINCDENDCSSSFDAIYDGRRPSRPPGASDTRPPATKPVLPRSSKPKKAATCSKWKSTTNKAKNDAKRRYAKNKAKKK